MSMINIVHFGGAYVTRKGQLRFITLKIRVFLLHAILYLLIQFQ